MLYIVIGMGLLSMSSRIVLKFFVLCCRCLIMLVMMIFMCGLVVGCSVSGLSGLVCYFMMVFISFMYIIDVCFGSWFSVVWSV